MLCGHGCCAVRWADKKKTVPIIRRCRTVLTDPDTETGFSPVLCAQACSVLCRGPDAVTRKMAVEFVKGEEEHCAWVAKHLAVIEKLGYDNYLLEMMDI